MHVKLPVLRTTQGRPLFAEDMGDADRRRRSVAAGGGFTKLRPWNFSDLISLLSYFGREDLPSSPGPTTSISSAISWQSLNGQVRNPRGGLCDNDGGDWHVYSGNGRSTHCLASAVPDSRIFNTIDYLIGSPIDTSFN
ncbi:hypothetical protein RRG08_021744 [Elysia crispata]|uniref:Uncharacterized protein n=1 Tax=Elysia crispata TaxID=231223 RepID=A0AAE1DQ39_9GAST|nr:hypothetical protein RRG08_021744 [Elysia crispata]